MSDLAKRRFGMILAARIEQVDIHKKDLAGAANVGDSAVSNWLKGDSVPSILSPGTPEYDDARDEFAKLLDVRLGLLEKLVTALDQSPGNALPPAVAAGFEVDALIGLEFEADQRVTVLPFHEGDVRLRAAELDRLDALQPSSGVRIVAVTGPAGTGKSALVRQFAHRAGKKYRLRAWVSWGDPFTRRGELEALAVKLGASTDAANAAPLPVVRERLSEHEPWLLVVDDAASLGELYDLLPSDGVGLVVVTSRNPDVGGHERIALDVFDPSDAADWICEVVGDDHRPAALEIAEFLGGLPLATAQTVCHLRRSKQRSALDPGPQAFLDYLRAQPISALSLEAPAEYPSSFIKLLTAIMGELASGSGHSLAVLRLAAGMGKTELRPDDLRGLVEIASLLTYSDWSGSISPWEIDAAIADLSERSILDSDQASEVIRIHSLTSDIVALLGERDEDVNSLGRHAWYLSMLPLLGRQLAIEVEALAGGFGVSDQATLEQYQNPDGALHSYLGEVANAVELMPLQAPYGETLHSRATWAVSACEQVRWFGRNAAQFDIDLMPSGAQHRFSGDRYLASRRRLTAEALSQLGGDDLIYDTLGVLRRVWDGDPDSGLLHHVTLSSLLSLLHTTPLRRDLILRGRSAATSSRMPEAEPQLDRSISTDVLEIVSAHLSRNRSSVDQLIAQFSQTHGPIK